MNVNKVCWKKKQLLNCGCYDSVVGYGVEPSPSIFYLYYRNKNDKAFLFEKEPNCLFRRRFYDTWFGDNLYYLC